MVDEPGIQLTATPASEWSAVGPLGPRALAFARRYAESTEEAITPCRIVVHRSAPEHSGLGTGTQLGLAVARALAEISGSTRTEASDLALRTGRGARSALGVHGFAQGGFLVEAGQRKPGLISPLVMHVEFPEDWRVVLILPRTAIGLYGRAEHEAFAGLGPSAISWTDALCRLVLLGMLPALVEKDIRAFGESVHDFNARVGEAFGPVQGGTYSSPKAAEFIRFARSQGIAGVGQSSWGPAVFAIVGNDECARAFANQLRRRFNLIEDEIIVTRARNNGTDVFPQ
jgi:beta-RFAP synthase